MNFLDIKVNPNSLLFSQGQRGGESSKSSREGDGPVVRWSGGAMMLGNFSAGASHLLG